MSSNNDNKVSDLSANSPGPATRRLQRLDVLRTVAILLVIGRHMRPCADDQPMVVRLVANAIQTCGWIGVDLFFVLSGFLVSGLLFKEYGLHRELRPIHFLIRRGFKIYPGYYCLLGATFAAWLIPQIRQMKWMSELSIANFVCEGVFLQNYVLSVWNHTWSLAVEEHFYILLAILFYFLTRLKNSTTGDPFSCIPLVFIIVACSVLGMRVATCYFSEGTYAPTHLRIDSLFFGVLISYYHNTQPGTLSRFSSNYWRVLTAIAVVTVLGISIALPLENGIFWYSVGYTFLYLIFGLLLLVVIVSPSPDGNNQSKKITNILASIGYYSYSIYLWHMPVRRGLFLLYDRSNLHLPYLVQFVVYIIICVISGVLIAKLIEIPALKFRDRIFPSRS